MDTKSFHLEGQHAPEGRLNGGSPKGEFHESIKSASEALLAGVDTTGEIHLKSQCASEGILKGVGSEGEFHENAKPAVISRLLCGELWGRDLLEQPRITACRNCRPRSCPRGRRSSARPSRAARSMENRVPGAQCYSFAFR